MSARELLQPAAFQIALRVRHPTMDPALISRELQLLPEHSFKAGEPRSSESGIAATHAQTYWLASIDPGTWLTPEPASRDKWGARGRRMHEFLARNLGTALGICATHLRRHASFIHRIQSEGGDVALRIVLSSAEIGTVILTPELLRSLGELAFAVELDFPDRD